MSYATVPAYHAFMAAKATIERATALMKERAELHARLMWQRRWWWPRAYRQARMLHAFNEMEMEHGKAVALVMNLSVAAMSVEPGAMIALDGEDFDLIREAFFDPKIATEARATRAFATMPGGTA